MDHFIDHITIRNFKSIKNLEVNGFKRINLFIGRPNVGKSNLLEALSLFSLPYVWEGSKKITDIVRLQNQRELFYDGNISNEIYIELAKKVGERKTRVKHCHILFTHRTGELTLTIFEYPSVENTDWFTYKTKPQLSDNYGVNNNFKLTHLSATRKNSLRGYIKPYYFSPAVRSKNVEYPFLAPPSGSNLLYVLELMPELRTIYAQWFKQYGLRLVLDTASQSVKIQKDKGDDEVFQLPYSSVADTLQRIIFYKTAVASNENSVLLFEEPEAHAYPPYIVEFTQEVIRSQTNQFFIVTHSPFIVNDFLEGAIDDLAIFMVDFKDGQTIAKPLTEEEIREVREYGVDLFFNNEAYLS